MKRLAWTLLLVLLSGLTISLGAPGLSPVAEAQERALDARFTRLEFQPDNVSTMVNFSGIVGRVEVRADAADMRVVGDRREFVLRGNAVLSLPADAPFRGMPRYAPAHPHHVTVEQPVSIQRVPWRPHLRR